MKDTCYPHGRLLPADSPGTCARDSRHRLLLFPGSNWEAMFERSTAAIVLATLGWVHLPVAFASPPMVPAEIHRSPSAAHNHSCCAGLRPGVAPIVHVPISSSGVPCGAHHPCCARQTPSAPSSLPVAAKQVRPRAERTLTMTADQLSSGCGRIFSTAAVLFLPPLFERSTVLRN
jgi:hypothetical protein